MNKLMPLAEALAAERLMELDAAPPPGEAREGGRSKLNGHAPAPKFILEPFAKITFEPNEEWLVKGFLPRQGTGVIFGDSQAFKSFVVWDLAVHIACGWDWAGRRVEQADGVYIAAEGSAGMKKRKVGSAINYAEELRGKDVPLSLISVAPNLGTGTDDLKVLIADIEATGVKPGFIVLDTIAPCIGSGDENGAGMLQLVANMTALANHFKCCVLGVHHVGLNDADRMRGHTSLKGGIDAAIFAKREGDTFSTTLKLVKLKDEASNIILTAHLARVVIGVDRDGEEISTLVVNRIEAGGGEATVKAPKPIPRSLILIMEMTAKAIEEAGEAFKPFANGPLVRAVSDEIVRSRYYARVAEKPRPDDKPDALAERQRRGFNRAVKSAIDAKDLMAAKRNDERLLWLP